MEMAPDLPNFSVDPDRLAQVLSNLVSNALRHTPAGGRVSLVAACQDRSVLLAVRDTGVGIPADELTHVFDRFYRIDADRSSSTGGAGLGLAIVRSIAELHGGNVDLQSEPGAGTTVTLSLPSPQSPQIPADS